MAGADAAAAYQAIWRLRTAPEQAAALLRQKLRPPPAIAAAHIAGWIRDLDADRFDVREKAMRALEKAGDQAEDALQRALTHPSLEVRRRAQRLLEALNSGGSSEEIRRLRAIEVLAFTATPAARDVLAKLAEGAPGARVTREARAALDHLQRRLPR
jgi:hypothetical protein